MTTIAGTYYRQGYYVHNDVGYVLYEAGNCAHDSSLIVDIDSPEAIPLRTLRSYCIKTAREIAAERGAYFAGVSRESE